MAHNTVVAGWTLSLTFELRGRMMNRSRQGQRIDVVVGDMREPKGWEYGGRGQRDQNRPCADVSIRTSHAVQ